MLLIVVLLRNFIDHWDFLHGDHSQAVNWVRSPSENSH